MFPIITVDLKFEESGSLFKFLQKEHVWFVGLVQDNKYFVLKPKEQLDSEPLSALFALAPSLRKHKEEKKA